ncbi:hypothetical protein [Streptomyces clavuligerus]|uniref:Lipoprotein n=1 Tax=Streptomyces clavuligerus TaxID=1901 RepID=B5H0H3_STRCL|nr:hypothetical protein [Streptomyces clavuligerus]ANW20267.1 hypothetical protein BB341_19655 [Streptomyces clavuligerus]AXU14892.1 hypothetical protein D1794_20475 [Streptomyces clavuligerus]EDY52069.1 lipoprotein [Streptomyces clavuligerus]EFG06800.1 Lipoprotein [Streptomyces clavuligerus]MBY6304934.1 hypothetical protein [Streptomyces clavuligerus]
MNGMTIHGTARGRRRSRGLVAIAVAGAIAAGTAACEPRSGERLRSGSVALTTDRMTTKTLERLGVAVNWFTCDADVAGEGASAPPAHATVDCRGETDSGQKITLTGRVTEERGGVCVRGDLTVRISGRTAFDATYLGDCSARPSAVTPRHTPYTPGGEPRPRPTVTVTVTETVTAVPRT